MKIRICNNNKINNNNNNKSQLKDMKIHINYNKIKMKDNMNNLSMMIKDLINQINKYNPLKKPFNSRLFNNKLKKKKSRVLLPPPQTNKRVKSFRI